jgi:hypothetical protein
MTAKEPSSSSSENSNDDSNSVQQQQQSQQTPYPAWHSVVAGGVAGLGSRMATAPLDFFRIRRQLNLAPDAHGIWRGLSHVYQNEGGIVALYRGNLAAIYLWIGYAACQFSVYHRVKDWLVRSSSLSTSPSLIVIDDDHSRAFVAGATAGSVALLVTYPLDVCRTQMVAHGIVTKHLVFASLYDPQTLPKTTTTAAAVETAAPQTLTGCARTLYQSRGLAGFYAGVRPALVQIIPYMGINFALYEALSSSSPFFSSSSLDETSSVSLAADRLPTRYGQAKVASPGIPERQRGDDSPALRRYDRLLCARCSARRNCWLLSGYRPVGRQDRIGHVHVVCHFSLDHQCAGAWSRSFCTIIGDSR